MITTSDLFTENGFTFFVFSFSVRYVKTIFIYHNLAFLNFTFLSENKYRSKKINSLNIGLLQGSFV